MHYREISSTVAQLPNKGCLDAKTEAVTVVVMDENMLDATEAAKWLHLSLKVVAFQEALLQAMKKVCCF